MSKRIRFTLRNGVELTFDGEQMKLSDGFWLVMYGAEMKLSGAVAAAEVMFIEIQEIDEDA